MKRSGTIPGKVYKYVHEKDEWLRTTLTGHELDSPWFRLDKDGTLTVKGSNGQGYAWDGCSPKWIWIQLIWGTPDGKLDYRTERPITYYASMFHDSIYQHKKEVSISRKEADILFMLILKESKYMWWHVYYLGVRLGGKFFGTWKHKRTRRGIKVLGASWLADPHAK